MAEELDVAFALKCILTEANTVFWLWEHHDQITLAIQQARDSRLLEYMKVNDSVTQRGFDDISRAFYRALAELRRQQDWRIRRSAISVDDVSPKPPAFGTATMGAT